jgi:osmotically-inducible protein OsmY
MSLLQQGRSGVELAGQSVKSFPNRDVEAQAAHRLRKSPYPEVRQVACAVERGVLTLRGCVPTYYLKQVAQNLVWQMDGVVDIDNQLDVIQPPTRSTFARRDAAGILNRRPR